MESPSIKGATFKSIGKDVKDLDAVQNKQTSNINKNIKKMVKKKNHITFSLPDDTFCVEWEYKLMNENSIQLWWVAECGVLAVLGGAKSPVIQVQLHAGCVIG